MKTKMFGAIRLAALAVGASLLPAQQFQDEPAYSGPAVLLSAEDHAERLLPGNPASRALDLAVWQEEQIADVRNRQRGEIAGLRERGDLDAGERRFLVADAVRRGGREVASLLTMEQRRRLERWVRAESDRVNMILGEDLVGRLTPFSWLSAHLGMDEDQLAAVARIRTAQRADLARIDAETTPADYPDDGKDRVNAVLVRHGEAVRALLMPGRVARWDAMWPEVY